MAKKVLTTIKLQAPGGQASPAPPVGPALGQHGINIMEFVKAFNAQTAGDMGTTIPVEITVFEDRSFTFVTKTPPAPCGDRGLRGPLFPLRPQAPPRRRAHPPGDRHREGLGRAAPREGRAH